MIGGQHHVEAEFLRPQRRGDRIALGATRQLVADAQTSGHPDRLRPAGHGAKCQSMSWAERRQEARARATTAKTSGTITPMASE